MSRPHPNPLPLGAEWLNYMPTQGGFIPPRGSGLHPQPVMECHQHTVIAQDGTQTQVLDWQYACVREYNIGQGTGTNEAVREWVRNIGIEGDQAGHIIGKNQGGSGTEIWNLIPQNSNFNQGVYSHDVERMIKDGTHLGDVQIWTHLVYKDSDYPGRPTEVQQFIQFAHGNPDGSSLNNNILNPRPFNAKEIAVTFPKNDDESPMKALMTEFDSRGSMD